MAKTWVGACLSLVLLGACFDSPSPECAFVCEAPEFACPDGYSCRPDGFCKQAELPDDFVCTDAASSAVDNAALLDGAPDQKLEAPEGQGGARTEPERIGILEDRKRSDNAALLDGSRF